MTFYDLKSDILDEKLSKPTIFNCIKPVKSLPFMSMSLEKFASILKEKKLKFRIGKHKVDSEVQWEGDCQFVFATLKEFMHWIYGKTECGPFAQYNMAMHWVYADYMYAKVLFNSVSDYDIFDEVKWSNFGFAEEEGRDMALWIGSKGAYTVCHYDTYGYNLVIQVFGRKRWTLFSPDDTDNMYPTRIPYEESTVFSKVNILNPDLSEHPRFTCARPHVVTLEAGDMLFVPPQWWHFVENLETSLSINAWFSHKLDDEQRFNEAITRLLVSSFMTYQSCDSVTNQPGWVNPTEEGIANPVENLGYLENALNLCRRSATYSELQTRLGQNHEEKTVCSCSEKTSMPLDIECFEIKQLCFEHACLENNNWKRTLERYRNNSSDIESENLQSTQRRKKLRLADENRYLQKFTLKKVAEIVSKPNVVNFIKKELVKDT